jgi:hypothetical protein
LFSGLAGVLVLIASASAAHAGVGECINAEQCAEPCPLVLCDTDGDCPSGEVCVVSSGTCCASSQCECLNGEWTCTADCITGVGICVSADEPLCVPALSGTSVALLAALMAAVLAGAIRRRRAS